MSSHNIDETAFFLTTVEPYLTDMKFKLSFFNFNTKHYINLLFTQFYEKRKQYLTTHNPVTLQEILTIWNTLRSIFQNIDLDNLQDYINDNIPEYYKYIQQEYLNN